MARKLKIKTLLAALENNKGIEISIWTARNTGATWQWGWYDLEHYKANEQTYYDTPNNTVEYHITFKTFK